jgi:hypothetical protein
MIETNFILLEKLNDNQYQNTNIMLVIISTEESFNIEIRKLYNYILINSSKIILIIIIINYLPPVYG